MGIDTLDVKIKDTVSGKLLEGVIEPMITKDFKTIKKNKDRFDKFDWSQYSQSEVYKLRLKDNDAILGLLCLIDHMDDGFDAIEIELLEVSAENIGKKKQLDFIGGCLIAFACRESFKRGHGGCVFLVPKSSLIDYYPAMYGFEFFPLKTAARPSGLMILNEPGARKLIKVYLDGI